MNKTKRFKIYRPPSVKIYSNFKWYKRLYIMFKNPITYLFRGYIEI